MALLAGVGSVMVWFTSKVTQHFTSIAACIRERVAPPVSMHSHARYFGSDTMPSARLSFTA
jgi:hypothetical protein